MPNWVFNYLEVKGEAAQVASLKAQLNKPFTVTHDSWDAKEGKMIQKDVTYSKPVFAFWNIIQPSDLVAYTKQPSWGDRSMQDVIAEALSPQGNDWYSWNNRNWGTKWDVGVADGEEYPDTEIVSEDETSIIYKFNTAWSPPEPAISCISMQYPDLEFGLEWEEEQGFGGTVIYVSGEGTITEDYESKCRNCDGLNCITYCENGVCDYDVCTNCGNNASDECEEHKALVS